MNHKEKNKGEGDKKQSYSLPHVTSDKRSPISVVNCNTNEHQNNDKISIDMSKAFILLEESVITKGDSKQIANTIPKPKWNYSQNKSSVSPNVQCKVEYYPSAVGPALASPLRENTQIANLANRRKTPQPVGNFTKGKNVPDTISQSPKVSIQESTDRRNRELGLNSLQGQQCNNPSGNCAQNTLSTIQEELRRTSQFARQKSSIISQNKENLQRDLLRIQDIKVLQQAKDQTVTRNLDAKQIMQLKRLLVPYSNSSQVSTLNGSIRQNQTIGKQPEIDCLESQQSSIYIDMEKKKITGSLNTQMQSTSRGRGTKKGSAMSQHHQQQQMSLKDDSSITMKMNISYNEDYLIRDERSPVNRSQPHIVLRDLPGNGASQSKKIDPSPYRSQLSGIQQGNNKNPEKDQGCEETEQEEEGNEIQDTKTKNWMKLQVDGNKINNVPSNIEFEINRIQKLAEKNELAMQEFVAVRSKIIQISSKVKTPSSSLSMSLQQ